MQEIRGPVSPLARFSCSCNSMRVRVPLTFKGLVIRV